MGGRRRYIDRKIYSEMVGKKDGTKETVKDIERKRDRKTLRLERRKRVSETERSKEKDKLRERERENGIAT